MIFLTVINFLKLAVPALLVFGFIIFIHELGHLIAAKRVGITVLEFSLGMGPMIFEREYKGTVYSLRAFPIGGFCAMEGEDGESSGAGAFGTKSPGKKFAAIAAGPLMNLVFGYVIMVVLVLMSGGIATTEIHSFYPEAATARYLREGDTIVAIDGHKIRTSNDISFYLIRNSDGIMDIDVMRDSELVSIKDVTFDTTDLPNGQKSIVLDFVVKGVKKTVINVPVYAFDWTVSIVKQIWASFGDLITGNVSFNEMSGPVGVAKIIGEASQTKDISDLLITTALITVNIGIFNLLPFPALDGGRLIFILLEAVRKKPVNPKIEEGINFAGFTVLIGFMLIVTAKDIIGIFK